MISHINLFYFYWLHIWSRQENCFKFTSVVVQLRCLDFVFQDCWRSLFLLTISNFKTFTTWKFEHSSVYLYDIIVLLLYYFYFYWLHIWSKLETCFKITSVVVHLRCLDFVFQDYWQSLFLLTISNFNTFTTWKFEHSVYLYDLIVLLLY